MKKSDPVLSRREVFMSFVMFPTKAMYKLYQWTIRWSKTKYAIPSLFTLALVESSFFPIPPDVLLIAMTVGNRFKWWIYASVATAGSVLGAIFGYYIGSTLFEVIGQSIVNFYHLQEQFNLVQIKYEQNAFLALFTAAFTPIPFKVFTIAAGAFNVSLSDVIVGSILGRAGRFFAVALALRIFGKKVEDTIERYFNILSIIFVLLLIAGFLLIKVI